MVTTYVQPFSISNQLFMLDWKNTHQLQLNNENKNKATLVWGVNTQHQQTLNMPSAQTVISPNVHGDVTIAQDICTTLQTLGGVRFNSFVKYCETYGNLAWDKESKNFVHFKNPVAVCDPAELVAQLHATRWFDAIKQEKPASVYDVEEMVRKMLTKLTNAAKREGVVIENEHLIDELAGLLSGDESDAE